MVRSLLRVKGLHKQFDGRYEYADAALRGVDLEVNAGEVVCIIGRNGAGKSTLLNALSGLLTVDEGSVEIDGHDVTNASAARIAAFGVARTFQLPRNGGVDQNALTPWQLRRCAEQPWGIPEVLRPNAMHSGPVRQRLNQLCVALNLRPRLLLLDEPLVGLTGQQVEAFEHVLDECKRNACGVLLVEHDLTLVRKWADRVILLDEGRIQLSAASRDGAWQNEQVYTVLKSAPHPKGSQARQARMAQNVVDRISVSNLTWSAPNGLFKLNVSHFECGSGIHQLIGPTGSGKSAFLAALVGLLPSRPQAGMIQLPGATRMPPFSAVDRLARAGVRYLPEVSLHVGCLTVEDVVRFARNRKTVGDVQLHGGWVIRKLFPTLGEERKRRERPHQLSGGQRQLLALARAFLMPAKCLLLDRPLQHLDELGGAKQNLLGYLNGIADTIPIVIAGAEQYEELHAVTVSWWRMSEGRLVQVSQKESS